MPTPRVEFLDQYRGFTVVLMIAVNLLAPFNIVPAWLKHSTQSGVITITDFVITMFMFIVGVAVELTLPRSIAAHGRWKTVWRFTRRSLLLIFFGVLGSFLLKRDLIGEWGVLQTIGTAGLVALPFAFLRPRYRPVVAILLIALYQAIGVLGHWEWLKANDTGHLGGIPGGLAWGGVVLLGSFVGSFVRTGNDKEFRLACSVVAVAGIGFTLLLRSQLPIFKPLVTSTYILVTVGFAAVMLLVFALARIRFIGFKVFGMNALAIFMLHGLLIETVLKLAKPASSAPAVLLAGAGLYGVCYLVAGLLYWKRVYIRL